MIRYSKSAEKAAEDVTPGNLDKLTVRIEAVGRSFRKGTELPGFVEHEAGLPGLLRIPLTDDLVALVQRDEQLNDDQTPMLVRWWRQFVRWLRGQTDMVVVWLGDPASQPRSIQALSCDALKHDDTEFGPAPP